MNIGAENMTTPLPAKSRWYQDDKLNTSAMLLIIVPGAMVGIGIAVAGAVAMFLALPAAGVALTIGAGMVATAQGAKALQAAVTGALDSRAWAYGLSAEPDTG